MLMWIKRLLARRTPPIAARLELTADGFRIHHAASVVDIRWADVRSILAFKVDRFTTDEIVLRFDVDGAAAA